LARCDVCGKGPVAGRNIRHKHSGRWERKAPKTNRVLKANIQKKTVLVSGVPIRLKICTRCLRTQLKATA
jgi:large subunit ribosomal protein L28